MNYVTLKTFKMKFTLSILAVIFASCSCQMNDSDTYVTRLIADFWIEGTDIVRIIWRDCTKKYKDVKDIIDNKEYYPKFVRCVKRKTLKALDRSLSLDVVPILDGVNLVRFEIIDHSGNILQENETSSWTEKELEEDEWKNLALKRLAKVFHTHVIKFDFEDDNIYDKVEYRGRRRHHMLTMMMFGVVSIGMVLVPMGFQFLAVLGGKALLLAKMALILASIQGLKKIAASPLSYGFYHSYPPFDHYDKRSREGHVSSTAYEPQAFMKKKLNQADDYIADLKAPQQDKRIANIGKEMPKNEAINKEDLRQYPIYTGLTSPDEMTSIYSQPTLVDLTTRPGEVQVDYSLDLPFNGFHFQSPTSVVSA
ncbi:uncharacterized protein LOC126768980 isoform X2 [Nymphalis io]|uniref:uncharacterized protein LOC126768980 isoform X2 n=1 Tax=Inachis io TaxID=171585 RepID=UPI0021697932|nr:uncharacterized protein LOC126768980 isoform X2 [Nymphalis io]